VPADLLPFQRETLALLGIDERQLEHFTGEEAWELESLYFSNCTTHAGWHRPDVDGWLRDTILRARGIFHETGHRRIYLSRRAGRRRRSVNEQAVVELLEQHGFETLVPETLSFRQQVEAFAEASIVVSTHGAALANILFAPPGLVVVEMIPPRMMRRAHFYWAMAESLRHTYWYFVAEDGHDGRHPADYVPIEKLEATLDRVLQSSPVRV